MKDGYQAPVLAWTFRAIFLFSSGHEDRFVSARRERLITPMKFIVRLIFPEVKTVQFTAFYRR
jgi:hypothetical protein